MCHDIRQKVCIGKASEVEAGDIRTFTDIVGETGPDSTLSYSNVAPQLLEPKAPNKSPAESLTAAATEERERSDPVEERSIHFVTSPLVNVRDRPDRSGRVIDQVSPDDRLRVIEVDGNWSKVELVAGDIGRGVGYGRRYCRPKMNKVPTWCSITLGICMAGSILPLGLDRPLYWICFTIILAIVISGILFFEIFGQSHYSDISWSSVHGDYIVAVLALFSAIVSIIIAFSNGNSLNTAFVPPHALLPFTYFLAYMLGRSLVVGRSAARRFMLGSHIGLIVIMAISLLAHGLDLGIADLGWDTWSDTYSGTLSNPNHMNLIAAICLAFCCNELLTIIGSSKSNKSPFRADARFLLVILGLTVSIVGIVATESRLFVAYLVPCWLLVSGCRWGFGGLAC